MRLWQRQVGSSTRCSWAASPGGGTLGYSPGVDSSGVLLHNLGAQRERGRLPAPRGEASRRSLASTSHNPLPLGSCRTRPADTDDASPITLPPARSAAANNVLVSPIEGAIPACGRVHPAQHLGRRAAP
jgi:hypothetical protein